MERYYIYLITDSNRQFLKIGIANDVNQLNKQLCNDQISTFFTKPRVTRIVHLEEYYTCEDANKRYIELSRYSHIVRERLIHKHNPNWLSLSAPKLGQNTKKAVVYA